MSLALQHVGGALWNHVGKEASGSAINSIVQLELEKGKPRNMWAQVEAQRGKIGKTKRKGGGVYVCPYRPPRVVGMGLDTISASVGALVRFPSGRHFASWLGL